MKSILVFLISMVPIVELRGAIPLGLSNWLGDPIPIIPLYIICIIGNMIPVPFIFFFLRKILVWGANRKWSKAFSWIGNLFEWILKKGEKGGKKLTKKTGQSIYLALLLFVGIPLPGTGAWTGTLAASILDLDFKKSVFATMLGVLLAGIIMALGSFGVFSLF